MIGPSVGQAAFRWATFIVVLSGMLLFVVRPGSAEFVITAFMFAVGIVFATVIAVVVRMKR
ncbi:MAG TPA: hypothetical protein VIL34_05260 [Actinopolymorphaceae bacterium]|jgi:hypothetical protein